MATIITGPVGIARQIDVDALFAKHSDPNGPPRELTLDSWVISAPWAHPIWHSYAVLCISLREVAGWPPAKINLPGATHEVVVFALSPEWEFKADEFPAVLHPANFVGQFIEPDDAAANARVRHAVEEITCGELNPDTDALAQWVERFGGSNLKRPLSQSGDFLVVDAGGGLTVTGTGAMAARALQEIAKANPDVKIDTPEKH